MKSSLLLLGSIAVLAVGAPANGQYIYMDVNGDGICTSADVITSSTTAVDVYLNTNHNAAGTQVACSDGTNPLDIGSYDLLFQSSPIHGSVQLNGWTNAMTGFTLLNAFTVAGGQAGVGFTGANYLSPGLYKLGQLSVTATGLSVISFLGVADPSIPSPVTGFGSHCSATDNPNTVTLGVDFSDNCSIAFVDAVESTTWGKIKQVYR